MEDEFLDFALKQDVGEIALEACFFDALDDGLCAEIKARLDETGVDRVLGWGHPEGLWGGDKPDELEALKRHLPQTRKLGSTRMRIVAASMNYAKSPREELIGKVIPLLAEATKAAEEEGVVLALENHIDFTSREIVRIIEAVGSPNLRVNFDTGNCLRLFEDPWTPPPGSLPTRSRPTPRTSPPGARRQPLGQLHLVAGVRGRRGRHRHAWGGKSLASRGL